MSASGPAGSPSDRGPHDDHQQRVGGNRAGEQQDQEARQRALRGVRQPRNCQPLDREVHESCDEQGGREGGGAVTEDDVEATRNG